MAAPKGLQDAMRVNYDGVVALAASRSRAILYAVRSGILQGDPASGTLFVLAAHPFGQYLKRNLDGKKRGLSRWCADDLGSTVNNSRGLATLARVFRAARALAGLLIKPAKCFAIPLGDPSSGDLHSRAREALVAADPEWTAFPIVDSLEYLGVLMGPGVTLEMQWSAPLKKYVDRVGDIARSRADAHAAVLLYQERCIPVLAYKAQLAEPSPNLKRIERAQLPRLLRLPGSFLGDGEYHDLQSIGGPQITAAPLWCAASLIRAATTTLRSWPGAARGLRIAARRYLPLVRTICGTPWPAWWRSDAFATTLERAAKGDGESDRACAVRALRAALAAAAARPAHGEVRERERTIRPQSVLYLSLLRSSSHRVPPPLFPDSTSVSPVGSSGGLGSTPPTPRRSTGLLLPR